MGISKQLKDDMPISPTNSQPKSDENRPAQKQAVHEIALVRNLAPGTTAACANDRNQPSANRPPVSTSLADTANRWVAPMPNRHRQRQERIARLAAIAILILGLATAILALQTAP